MTGSKKPVKFDVPLTGLIFSRISVKTAIAAILVSFMNKATAKAAHHAVPEYSTNAHISLVNGTEMYLFTRLMRALVSYSGTA